MSEISGEIDYASIEWSADGGTWQDISCATTALEVSRSEHPQDVYGLLAPVVGAAQVACTYRAEVAWPFVGAQIRASVTVGGVTYPRFAGVVTKVGGYAMRGDEFVIEASAALGLLQDRRTDIDLIEEARSLSTLWPVECWGMEHSGDRWHIPALDVSTAPTAGAAIVAHSIPQSGTVERLQDVGQVALRSGLSLRQHSAKGPVVIASTGIPRPESVAFVFRPRDWIKEGYQPRIVAEIRDRFGYALVRIRMMSYDSPERGWVSALEVLDPVGLMAIPLDFIPDADSWPWVTVTMTKGGPAGEWRVRLAWVDSTGALIEAPLLSYDIAGNTLSGPDMVLTVEPWRVPKTVVIGGSAAAQPGFPTAWADSSALVTGPQGHCTSVDVGPILFSAQPTMSRLPQVATQRAAWPGSTIGDALRYGRADITTDMPQDWDAVASVRPLTESGPLRVATAAAIGGGWRLSDSRADHLSVIGRRVTDPVPGMTLTYTQDGTGAGTTFSTQDRSQKGVRSDTMTDWNLTDVDQATAVRAEWAGGTAHVRHQDAQQPADQDRVAEMPTSCLTRADAITAAHRAMGPLDRGGWSRVIIDLTTGLPAPWPEAMGLDVGSRIRYVYGTEQGEFAQASGGTVQDLTVTGMTEVITGTRCTITASVIPYVPQGVVADGTALEDALGADGVTGGRGYRVGTDTAALTTALTPTYTGPITITSDWPVSQDPSDYPAYIATGPEAMRVSGATGPYTLTISERGARGTVPTAHDAGDPVGIVHTANAI